MSKKKRTKVRCEYIVKALHLDGPMIEADLKKKYPIHTTQSVLLKLKEIKGIRCMSFMLKLAKKRRKLRNKDKETYRQPIIRFTNLFMVENDPRVIEYIASRIPFIFDETDAKCTHRLLREFIGERFANLVIEQCGYVYRRLYFVGDTYVSDGGE